MKKPFVEFRNEEQIINMGGPYVGDLYIDGRFVEPDVVVDTFAFGENESEIYFSKCYRVDARWRSGIYFQVLRIAVPTFDPTLFTKKFSSLIIETFEPPSKLIIRGISNNMKLSEFDISNAVVIQ